MLKTRFTRCTNGERFQKNEEHHTLSSSSKKVQNKIQKTEDNTSIFANTEAENRLPEQQTGFKWARSTLDNSLTPKLINEKRIHLTFIDKDAAYLQPS